MHTIVSEIHVPFNQYWVGVLITAYGFVMININIYVNVRSFSDNFNLMNLSFKNGSVSLIIQ